MNIVNKLINKFALAVVSRAVMCDGGRELVIDAVVGSMAFRSEVEDIADDRGERQADMALNRVFDSFTVRAADVEGISDEIGDKVEHMVRNGDLRIEAEDVADLDSQVDGIVTRLMRDPEAREMWALPASRDVWGFPVH